MIEREQEDTQTGAYKKVLRKAMKKKKNKKRKLKLPSLKDNLKIKEGILPITSMKNKRNFNQKKRKKKTKI